ncbi:MAG: type IV pilus assembly protein PilM [Candidatus Pacebacteria bacterium]|nr:type IV pilus assembly protein PilM [Candidatus Paceibacterota bacterium]MBP9851617.1 type IV pilus assembly protein PilM [Candidatus Paceibacterota bacterium]
MVNIFGKIFGIGGGGLSGSSESVIGIDIGTSAIKVVEIKRKDGKAALETYGAISLGPYAGVEIGRVTNLPIEKIAEALTEVIKQSGVTTQSGAMAVPVQSSLIFTIMLPSRLEGSGMKSIVETEARKYIPVPMDEVSLDYFVLPHKELSFEEANNPDRVDIGEKTEVLAVAIQNEAVEKLRNLVTSSKLDVSFFEVEIFSAVRANFEHELSLVLLVDFGASRTKLCLVEFGVVKSYHAINRGGADITNSIAQSLAIPFDRAEELKKQFGLYENPVEKEMGNIIKSHIDYIFSETNNVLLGHEKKYGRAVSKIIFTGGGALMKGLKEVGSNNFKAEVEVGHPFTKIHTPEFLKKVLETTGPEFAVALGLALRKLQ